MARKRKKQGGSPSYITPGQAQIIEEFGLGGWLKDNIKGVLGGLKTLGGAALTGLSGGLLAPIGLPMMAGGIGDIAGEIKGDRMASQQQNLYNQQMAMQGKAQEQQEEADAEAKREQYYSTLQNGPSNNPFTPTFPYGGAMGHSQAEIEGGEVIQFPNGNLDRPQGPSHAQGGMDITAPVDTRIFSDKSEYEKGITYAAKADAIRKEIEKYKKLLS